MSQKKVKQQRRETRRKQAEFRAALAEQLRLLEKRCREFDGGDLGEAVGMATRLRVIFQEGSKSKNPSLLQSLEAQKVPMLSSVEPREDSENVLSFMGGLYRQRFAKDESGMHYELQPKLGDLFSRYEMPAHRWWNGIVEIKGDQLDDPGRHVYRRMDVAKDISEYAGGAHFASKISESYDVMTRPGGLVKITFEADDRSTQEVPIEGVHLAMLRQIAYEVLNSPALRDLADPEKG